MTNKDGIYISILAGALAFMLIMQHYTGETKYETGRIRQHGKAMDAVMSVYDEKCNSTLAVEGLRDEKFCDGVREVGLKVYHSQWK